MPELSDLVGTQDFTKGGVTRDALEGRVGLQRFQQGIEPRRSISLQELAGMVGGERHKLDVVRILSDVG